MTEQIKKTEKVFGSQEIPAEMIKKMFKDAFNTNDENTLNDLYDMYNIFKQNKYGFDNQFEYINNMYKVEGHLKGEDYKNYLDFVVGTEAFKTSDRIIQKMLNNKNLDTALGFTTPQLILDPNVKNFYDFKSPKMRTGTALTVEDGKLVREGKIIDNEVIHATSAYLITYVFIFALSCRKGMMPIYICLILVYSIKP